MKLIAFYSAKEEKYFRGYTKTGEPHWADIPLLYPHEMKTAWGMMKRHTCLIDCCLHVFEQEKTDEVYELSPEFVKQVTPQ